MDTLLSVIRPVQKEFGLQDIPTEYILVGIVVAIVLVMYSGNKIDTFDPIAANHYDSKEAPLGGDPFIDERTGSVIMDGRDFIQKQKFDVNEPAISSLPEDYYFLDDGSKGKMSIQHNLCSRSCCSEQYPTPFKMKHDPYVCQNKDKFVPSQIMCNNTFQDSGCLCLTKDQAEHIYNRGGNGRDWF